MNIAVFFAGGTGERFSQFDKPKQFIDINGIPLIVRTLMCFQKHKEIDSIVISCLPSWMDYCKELVSQYELTKVIKIVPSGETSQVSIYNGLVVAKELSTNEDDIVLVCDAVRPFISQDLITENIRCTKANGSSISCGEIFESTVVVGDGIITTVQNREMSRSAKAPQCFKLNELFEVHKDAFDKGNIHYVDCCSLMLDYGKKLSWTDSPLTNIKITTLMGYYGAKAFLDNGLIE